MADVSGPAPKNTLNKYSAVHLILRGQKPQNRVWHCSVTKTKLSDSNDSNTISQEWVTGRCLLVSCFSTVLAEVKPQHTMDLLNALLQSGFRVEITVWTTVIHAERYLPELLSPSHQTSPRMRHRLFVKATASLLRLIDLNEPFLWDFDSPFDLQIISNHPAGHLFI